ncbi:ester cyclase [Kribbella sp. NPDC051718]|uniref:ester cyclase n=1 Tax=Kribbella sp. NPDC051718 TaxID=3155168 RepID=UPI00341CDA56
MTSTDLAPKEVAIESLMVMATGSLEDFRSLFHPEATNRMAVDEPLACRGTGPDAYYATAVWLRSAYADLGWTVEDSVVEGDLVVLHATMSGRHTGPFVTYDENGRAAQAFPPTGKTFAVTQSHWFRLADGKVIEHWANRDDLGQAMQLGWIPPTPVFLVRMLLALRKARRA